MIRVSTLLSPAEGISAYVRADGDRLQIRLESEDLVVVVSGPGDVAEGDEVVLARQAEVLWLGPEARSWDIALWGADLVYFVQDALGVPE